MASPCLLTVLQHTARQLLLGLCYNVFHGVLLNWRGWNGLTHEADLLVLAEEGARLHGRSHILILLGLPLGIITGYLGVFARSSSVASAAKNSILIDLIGLAHAKADGEHLLIDGNAPIVTRVRHDLQRVHIVVSILVNIKRSLGLHHVIRSHLLTLLALLQSHLVILLLAAQFLFGFIELFILGLLNDSLTTFLAHVVLVVAFLFIF